jgi:LuxR family maltose regulon positive regulatory protein
MATKAGDTELSPPQTRMAQVRRVGLLARLREARDVRVVSVSAPAGYGKTALIAQWTAEDERPFAWLSLFEGDNDPAVLVSYVVRALNTIEPLDERTIAAVLASPADLMSVLLPRLGSVLAKISRPFVLVLDDVHALSAAGAVAVLDLVVKQIPPGSQVVLISREQLPVPLSRLRVSEDLLDLGAEDLAMSATEGAALLRTAGVKLDPEIEEALVARTEGWPAGLHLAAIAIRAQPDQTRAAEQFAGDDRLVADYLREQVLRTLPDEHRDFLLASSVLGKMSGVLCDEILERTGSARLLEDLARANPFVVPLDRHGEWYRYHQLFRDMLRTELRHRDPQLERGLHERASRWEEAHGDADSAIEHARAAGDLRRVAALMWRNGPAHLQIGHQATVARWLAPFTVDEIAASPPLALTKALWCLTSGNTSEIEPWATAAANGGTKNPLPDGTPLLAALALLGALVGGNGLTQMSKDAALAFELDRPDSPTRPMARYLEGSALRLLGHRDLARARLEDGMRLASDAAATNVHCLNQLALLDIDDGAWSDAESLINRAMRLVDDYHLGERPAMTDVYATAALVHARHGATPEAQADAKHGLWLLEMIAGIGPWLVAESGILLARANLLLGDVATARMLTHEARAALARYSDAGTLPDRLREVEQTIDASAMPVGLEATPLTPAEMRVLRYLPTHLSYDGIATELFVSRNTVKSQAIAAYRKLGVSSAPRPSHKPAIWASSKTKPPAPRGPTTESPSFDPPTAEPPGLFRSGGSTGWAEEVSSRRRQGGPAGSRTLRGAEGRG